MGAITHNTGYVSEGLGRLLAIFKDKPRITAWLTSYLEEFQAAEDALWDVFVKRLLQDGVATGDLLAKLGKLVGQTSEGLLDPQFLTLITARIKANRARGWRQTLLDIAALLVPSTPIYAKNFPPAAIMIMPRGPFTLPPQLVAISFLARATGAGILLMFVWSSVVPANTLTLGSVWASSNPTAAQSPGSVYAVGTGGGKCAGAVQVNGGAST